jgi:hypothetical protein
MATTDLEDRLLLRVMRRLISELEVLSVDDLAALARHKGTILSTGTPSSQSPSAATKVDLTRDQIDTIRRRLDALPTREAGEQMLNAEVQGRSQLIQIAKAIDIPVNKRHTIQEIIEKIATATIGFRTRSAAIRGQDAKSGD